MEVSLHPSSRLSPVVLEVTDSRRGSSRRAMSLLSVRVQRVFSPRLRGDKHRLQKGKNKTSVVVVDVVTTSVETVGRLWRRISGGRRCLRQCNRRIRRRRRSRSASVQSAGRHPCGAWNTGALMVTL